ncbi:uncharacterized protein B0I36DRAFT_332412 [Microdochium trichocladiopsis]|uniref:Uncharacterized protein n=1 Tax=Microdochium trichocladiopsis TaxID=1682393 RepID=A0A9P8XYB1_9PEZI|nr:uncharacterized protein B0I36DRAFT_332412 [Microdochium trichocladiopsis]KAH7025022.1 hypothetical protein B0I36DRAFT_332412 [Microdochium trichocladiopsis]
MAQASPSAGAFASLRQPPQQHQEYLMTISATPNHYDPHQQQHHHIAARTELACIFGLLIIVVALRTRLTIGRALRAFHRPANLWLLAHIAISFFELGRLQWRALGGQPVHPTLCDLALGLAHCFSSYQVLLRRTRAGYKDLIPLGLRIQPFLFRLVTTILAFFLSSPSLHRANIRLGFDSFLYARLLIFSCTKLSPVALGPRTLHTAAAVLGGFLATYDSGFRHGSPAYVVCSAVSILLDGRTAQFMARLSDTPNSPTTATTTGTPSTRTARETLSPGLQRYIRILLCIKAVVRAIEGPERTHQPLKLPLPDGKKGPGPPDRMGRVAKVSRC